MKSKTLTFITAMTLFAALAWPVQIAAQEDQLQSREIPRYTVTDIGPLDGCCSQANGVNNLGSIAGASLTSGNAVVHALFWDKGVITDLGTLGGPNSNTLESQMIDDRDEIAGFSDTPDPDPNGEDFCGFGTSLICLPFVWEKGMMAPLPTLGGTNGQALGINNRGQIVGQAETLNVDSCSPFALQVEAVVWRDHQIEQVLAPLGGTAAFASAVNDNGDAVGLSGCITTTFLAVLWQHGSPIDLGSLGGVFGNIPSGLNNRGEVVGQSDISGDTLHHAFLWRNGVMKDLGSLPGLPTSVANGINNNDAVVGFSQDANGDDASSVAWIWQNGVITDLNDLIADGSPWFLMEALGINDRGEIAGFMFNSSTGEVHGFLATPVRSNENAVHAAPIRERPQVVLRENVRKLLRQRMADRWQILRLGVPRK